METACWEPWSADEAVRGLLCAARFLARADYPDLPPAVRGEVLRGLSQAGSILTVAQALATRAFDLNDEHSLDGYANTTSWLRNQARTEDAKAWVEWSRKTARHPVLTGAVRDEVVPASWALKLMAITSKIPPEARPAAEEIITDLAAAGGNLDDLRRAAAAALAATATVDPDDDGDFEDRYLSVQTTMGGAGTIRGNSTPEFTAALLAVISALGKKCGKDDDRTAGQRAHDAVYIALLRLLGTNLVPDKDGKPVTAMVHMHLADLIVKAEQDGSPLAQQWITGQAARWAAHLTDGTSGGDGGPWVHGTTARGVACEAVLFPVVYGDPDLDHLDTLVSQCVTLDQWTHAQPPAFTPDRDVHRKAIADLTRAIIGTCAGLMSGTGGLASFLRTNMLGEIGLGGPSLPLDVGTVDAIPWHLRKAVRARDITCTWPGGCDLPAWGAEPHHLVHRADGGPTSLTKPL